MKIDFFQAVSIMLLGFHIAGIGNVSWAMVFIPVVLRYLIAIPASVTMKLIEDAIKEKSLRDQVMR